MPLAENIERQAGLIFKRLNELHPFRGGNGRTQRAFLMQLIHSAGYDINFGDINTDLLMIAAIQSVHGITDFLKKIFRELYN